MAKQESRAPMAGASLRATQVYLLAALCLLAGLVVGYVARGTRLPASAVQAKTSTPSVNPHAFKMDAGHRPTLADMRQMADKQAAPLLVKLKTNPNDASVLAQIGSIYHSTHQFHEAAQYFGRASAADPGNVTVRTKLAISLYREGDVDGALAQLTQALAVDPKNANALFNLGLIRLEGKQDEKGALAAWQQLLKTNPSLSPDRKEMVQKLMAEAQSAKTAHARPGGRTNE